MGQENLTLHNPPRSTTKPPSTRGASSCPDPGTPHRPACRQDAHIDAYNGLCGSTAPCNGPRPHIAPCDRTEPLRHLSSQRRSNLTMQPVMHLLRIARARQHAMHLLQMHP